MEKNAKLNKRVKNAVWSAPNYVSYVWNIAYDRPYREKDIE